MNLLPLLATFVVLLVAFAGVSGFVLADLSVKYERLLALFGEISDADRTKRLAKQEPEDFNHAKMVLLCRVRDYDRTMFRERKAELLQLIDAVCELPGKGHQ